MNSIADRLRAAREQVGMSQADFGALAGVKRNAQMNYESGARTPDAIYLAALARHGIDVSYIVTGDAQSARLTTDETLLLQAYRGLGPAEKTAALGAVVGIQQSAGGSVQNFHKPVGQVAGGNIINQKNRK